MLAFIQKTVQNNLWPCTSGTEAIFLLGGQARTRLKDQQFRNQQFFGPAAEDTRWVTQSSRLPCSQEVKPFWAAVVTNGGGDGPSAIGVCRIHRNWYHLRPLFCALKNIGYYNITTIFNGKEDDILKESRERWTGTLYYHLTSLPNIPIPIHYLMTHTVKIEPLGRKEDAPGYLVRTLVAQLGNLIIFQSCPWEQFPCLGTTALKWWSEEYKSSYLTAECRTKKYLVNHATAAANTDTQEQWQNTP